MYGTQGSLAFNQESPEVLWLGRPSATQQRIWRGATGTAGEAAPGLPPGHPEGYYEAFAQLYRDFALQWRARAAGAPLPPLPVPGIDEGRLGMAFIDAVLRSHRAGSAWVGLR